jgi:ATP diphosphatase
MAERHAARQAAGVASEEPAGLLAGIPSNLPALTRADKLQARASSIGFDWNDARQVLAKVREETEEIAAALGAGDRQATAEEVGDLLFTVANLARHAGVDPEAALRGTNAKFERRFGFIERELRRQGRVPGDASLDEMEALWQLAKTAGSERAG